jgi:hypothetical protein
LLVSLAPSPEVHPDRQLFRQAFQNGLGVIGAAIFAHDKFDVGDPRLKFRDIIPQSLFDDERFIVDYKNDRNSAAT